MYNFIHEVISWSRIAARAPDSPCIYQPTRNTRLSFCRHFPGTVRTTFAHFPLARICNMVTAWGWGDFYSGQPYAQLKKKKKKQILFSKDKIRMGILGLTSILYQSHETAMGTY